MRATIYNRVSSDDSGKAASVTEQEAENRAECARRGWDVVAVYTDNDIGASRFSAGERTEYGRLLDHVRAGETDVIVLWEDSRMTRRLDEYTTLRDLCMVNGTLWCISGSLKDMRNKGDRMSTGLTAMMSEEASAETSARVLRSVNARVAAGRPHGRLVYGYRREYEPTTGAFLRQVEDAENGPIVREIAKRFLSGESMWSIHNDLNARGVPSLDKHRSATHRDGTEWTHNMLRRILMNPHYAGIRVRNGVEEPTRGDWPVLIAEEDHRQIVAYLSNPDRRTSRDTQARYLLSGIAICGKCGRTMQPRNNRGSKAYTCQHDWLSRSQDKVDAVVSAEITTRLMMPDAMGLFARDDSEAAQAQATMGMLRGQIAETEDAIADGELSPASGGRVIARLEDRLSEAEAKAVPDSVSASAVSITGPDAARRWEALTIGQKRDVVRSLLTVTILPAGAGARTFDPSLIRMEWNGTE